MVTIKVILAHLKTMVTVLLNNAVLVFTVDTQLQLR